MDFTNTTYVTYSVKPWAVAWGVIAIADGMFIAVIAFCLSFRLLLWMETIG